jgi:hypothetical protein
LYQINVRIPATLPVAGVCFPALVLPFNAVQSNLTINLEASANLEASSSNDGAAICVQPTGALPLDR